MNSTDKPVHHAIEHRQGEAETGMAEKGLDQPSMIIDSAAERRLLIKQDLVIMPFAVLLYLSAYLDRGNMGNARLQGLQATVLEGSDTNYSIALCCFFITYILLSVPGTLLAKAFNPSRTIAIGALIWSVAATAQAGTSNPAGVFVTRLFIGVGEAMFGQAMALHLSFWYTKQDLAKRVGFFISAGALAGAFGGLIAYGVSSIKSSMIPQWRILFLIEGIPSFVLAVATWFFLPNRPATSKFLNEQERTLALTRLNRSAFVDSETGLEWEGVRRCLTDWKTYVVSISYSCMNLTLASVGGFLPTIIQTGFGKSAADAQLFTVPPYAVALVFMLLLTAFSDRKQIRGPCIAAVFGIGVTGWAILLGIPAAQISQAQYSARYFACICIATAGYTNIPLIISWQAGNTGSQSQRATSLGMLNTLGQCLSLAASFLFPTTEAPSWKKGCAVNLAFQILGMFIALSMTAYYKMENKKRDRLEGGRLGPDVRLQLLEYHDRAPGFRYTA